MAPHEPPKPSVPVELAEIVRAGVKANKETVTLNTPDGDLIVPTLEELLRVKAFLAYQRNAMRDFMDLAELSCLLPFAQVIEALSVLDEKVGWQEQPSVILEVIKSLAACKPQDAKKQAFSTFKFLRPRLKSWEEVQKICHEIAEQLTVWIIGA
jgi:hypothetical protein